MEAPLHRQTIFDYLSDVEQNARTNKYLNLSDLRNEASVEQFFVQRLIEDLGYRDTERNSPQGLFV